MMTILRREWYMALVILAVFAFGYSTTDFVQRALSPPFSSLNLLSASAIGFHIAGSGHWESDDLRAIENDAVLDLVMVREFPGTSVWGFQGDGIWQHLRWVRTGTTLTGTALPACAAGERFRQTSPIAEDGRIYFEHGSHQIQGTLDPGNQYSAFADIALISLESLTLRSNIPYAGNYYLDSSDPGRSLAQVQSTMALRTPDLSITSGAGDVRVRSSRVGKVSVAMLAALAIGVIVLCIVSVADYWACSLTLELAVLSLHGVTPFAVLLHATWRMALLALPTLVMATIGFVVQVIVQNRTIGSAVLRSSVGLGSIGLLLVVSVGLFGHIVRTRSLSVMIRNP